MDPDPLPGAGQSGRLVGQARRCGRDLLDERGILLRRLVHLRDRLTDLLDPGRLLAARGADVAGDPGHLVHRCNDLLYRLAGLGGEIGARVHLAGGLLDEGLDLLRRLGAALREAAYLARYDREAAALVAGARRLDRGVQGQDVGLERNAVDDAGDLGDSLRALGDLFHRTHHLADDFAAPARPPPPSLPHLLPPAALFGLLP